MADISPDEILIDVLKEQVTATPVETNLMLLENYDIYYGIFNHGLYTDRPFSLIEMHDAERFDIVNPLYELMEKYARRNIFKHFGLNFTEFVALPREEIYKMFEVSTVLDKEESAKADPLLRELENLNKQHKK